MYIYCVAFHQYWDKIVPILQNETSTLLRNSSTHSPEIAERGTQLGNFHSLNHVLQLNTLLRMHLRQICIYILCSLLLATNCIATNMTVVRVYDVDSCTGVPLQAVFTPSNDCTIIESPSDCSDKARDMGIFASGNCTDDPRSFASATFQDFPFVLVELYTSDTNCSSLEGVAAYRVDDNCHPTIDASISFRADRKDETSSFTLYDDSLCSSMPLFQHELSGNECVSGSFKLYAVPDL